MLPDKSTSPDDAGLEARAKRAQTLASSSAKQSALGKREAALAFLQQAVDIYRTLSKERPETFLANLATSLHDLSTIQRDAGQREAALVTAMESVDLHHVLAKTHPENYLPRLAISLNQLSLRLRELGRHQEALPLAQAALDWIWPYYERFPETHGKHVGAMFSLLGALHEDLGSRLDSKVAERLEQYVTKGSGREKKQEAKINKVRKGKRASSKR